MKLSFLFRRERPHYGQVSLWLILLACLFLLGQTWCCSPLMPSGQAVTLLSWLPPDWLDDGWLYSIASVLCVASALCWLAQVLLPWSSWSTLISFTVAIAVHQEQLTYVDHMFQLSNQVLVVYALWYQFEHAAIRAALRVGAFWSRPLCPRWVRLLPLLLVGLFYFQTGFNKLSVSGVGWVNGVSLQLWVDVFGRDGLLSELVLSSRGLARFLQGAALAVELAALLALPSRRLRTLVGCVLIGFHIGQVQLFGWAFHANALLIALTYLPVDRLLSRLAARVEATVTPRTVARHGLLGALRARLNLFGHWRLDRPPDR